MVAITDSDGWVSVTRPEITDIALGGNEANFPGKYFRELASRDKYLYQTALGGDATAIASSVAFRQLGIAATAQGRLTLETGVPVSTTNQTAKTVLYYTPYSGDYVALYNTVKTRWDLFQFTERSLSLSGLAANTNYDIFIWDNSGTLTLQAVAWASSGAGTSTRASAITQLNGVWVKDSDKRRYLGTIRTTATIGQCEDSLQNRYVYNVDSTVQKSLKKQMTEIGLYVYTSSAWRAVFNDTTQQIRVVIGLPQNLVVQSGLQTSGVTPTSLGQTNHGFNSTTARSADIWGSKPTGTDQSTVYAIGAYSVPIGFNYWQMLEWGGPDEQFYGVFPDPEYGTSGIISSVFV